ncbi:hypothetical protein [Flavobacterium notoginsengisoli]|uniref:hypothetical protein n=1 Tax=Flavobacterium notoginsengisoli TaxID=1478199 RepID=UPI00362FD37C
MFKKYIFLSLIFCGINSFSQEIVNSIPVQTHQDSQFYQAVNDSSKQTTLFVVNEKENLAKAIQLDEKMQVLNSVSGAKSDKSYSSVIGNMASDKAAALVWSSNKKKILVQSFDLKDNKTNEKTYNLEFKEEVYLQDYCVGNKFIILSIVKKSNLFKLYVFDELGNLEIKDIDLSGVKFYHRTNLYDTFLEDFASAERGLSLAKITPETITPPSIASRKRKSYVIDNQIVISFDSNQNYTQVIQIDLETYKMTSKNFLQRPLKDFGTTDVKCNSFVIKDQLYQVKMSSKKMYLTIKDLNNNLIKEYILEKDSPIDFMNSPKNRTVNTSAKDFFRNFNFGDESPVAISCYEINENNLTSISALSAGLSTGQAVMMNFGAVGGLIGALAFSPSNDKTANAINSLFDHQGNHIEGDLERMAVDKIEIFLTENKSIDSKLLFKNDDAFYLGYFNSGAKEFVIRKFVN